MIKVVSALVATALAATLATTPTSYADQSAGKRPATVKGTVVTYAGGSVSGLTVRLRAVTRSGIGEVVGTGTTSTSGKFAVSGGSSAKRYYVELVPGTFQRGWAGGSDPRYFQFRTSDADTYLGNSSIGDVVATPSFVSGKVVDSNTLAAVPGIKITMTKIQGRTSTVSGTTDRRGRFRIDGLVGEDFSMRFYGSSAGYESGYWGCSGNVEVPDLECQASFGVIKKSIRIDDQSMTRAANAKKAPAKRLIGYGQIGKVKSGMTVDQAVATGETVENTPGDCPGETVRLRPNYPFNRQYVTYVNDADRVTEMDVFGRSVRTGKGIGVGSTVAAVKKAYGSKLGGTVQTGYGQWGKFMSSGTGANRVWIGYLFGDALVDDGPLTSSDKVTFVGVSRGARPDLIGDGC